MIARMLSVCAILSLIGMTRGLAQPAGAGPLAKNSGADRYTALVEQLGSADAKVREAAGKKLLAAGARALPALEKGLGNADYTAEHREAIGKLIQQINEAVDKRARELLGRKIPAINEVQGVPFFQIVSDDLDKLFPGCTFYGLRFRQFPVAREVPEPFKMNNAFVVKPDGSARDVTEAKNLQDFFQDNAKVDDAGKAKTATRAWLRIAEDLENDGFFRFTIPEESLLVVKHGAQLKASGKAVVANQVGGNRGQIEVKLTFEEGQLLEVDQSSKLRQGPRPICQARRLLDPDPVVRTMARQCILTMGKSAHEYLQQQRRVAPPRLREAIDEIWERIVREDW